MIGVEYENKFSEEIKKRLDNNLDKYDYQYAEKKHQLLQCNSKVVREAIRGYYAKSVLNPISVSSITWPGLKSTNWFYKVVPKLQSGKSKVIDGFDAIFLDYYNVSENNWIDLFNSTNEYMDRIKQLIEDNLVM